MEIAIIIGFIAFIVSILTIGVSVAFLLLGSCYENSTKNPTTTTTRSYNTGAEHPFNCSQDCICRIQLMAGEALQKILNSAGIDGPVFCLMDNPNWDRKGLVDGNYCWQDHVPLKIKEEWLNLSMETRIVAYIIAYEAAVRTEDAIDERKFHNGERDC